MSLASIQINSPIESLNHGCGKRKGSDNEEESCHRVKKPKYSYYVTLESESPQPSDEDDHESTYSVQGRETEYVRDTSDTSTHTWVTSSDSDVVHVEYEVASLSEKENPFGNDSSTSDPEDIVTMGVLAAICDSDLGLADDSDTSRSSVDSEIGKADYWTCIQCNARNNNPLFRYCEKCYQIRKNFFPPRPKRKRQRRSWRERNKSIINKDSEKYKIHDLQESATDSGFFSSQGSKYSFTLDLNAESLIRTNQCDTPTSTGSSYSKDSAGVTNSNFPSTSTLSEDRVSSSSQENEGNGVQLNCNLPCNIAVSTTVESKENKIIDSVKETENLVKNCAEESLERKESIQSVDSNERTIGNKMEINDLSKTQSNADPTSMTCLTCTLNPKNGAFVHGSILHICCCYRCAVKVWRNSGTCPICNRKITNVLKAFYT